MSSNNETLHSSSIYRFQTHVIRLEIILCLKLFDLLQNQFWTVMTPCNYLSSHNFNSHNLKSHNLNCHNLNSHNLNSHNLNSHDLNCHNLKSHDLNSPDLNCHNLNCLMRVIKSAFTRWRDCHCRILFPQWLTWASAPTRWSATPSPTSSASATESGTWHTT